MRFDFFSSLRALSRDAKLYLLSNVMQATSVGALAILYTLFLTALGYDAQFIGALAVVGTLGGAFGLIPSGALLDRVGWRTTLIFSNALGGAAILTQLLVPLQPVLYVTTFFVGVSVAMTIVVNAPLLAGASTPAERTTLFGVNNALNFLAGVLGTLLGGFLPEWLKSPAVQNSAFIHLFDPLLVSDPTARAYQAALLIVGALAIPSLIPIFLMRDERTRAASTPQPPPEPNAALPAEVGWRARARFLTNEGKQVARGPIGRFSASQLFIGLGAGLFFPFLSIYFVNELGATTAQFGVLSSVQTLLLAGAALLSVPLAARFGKLRLAIVAQALSLPFLIALGVTPLLGVAAVAFLLRASLMNLGAPGLQAYYMEAVPEGKRGLASSVYNGAWQGAWALGALIGGTLISLAGYGSVFLAAAVCYATSILLLAWWFGGARQHGVSEEPAGEPAPALQSETV
jgi:MFS family permease